MPKRILRQFRLDEISAVDKPAVEGALALIMKQRSDVRQTDAPADFDSAVSLIQKRDNCPRHLAMSKARGEYGRLYSAYQLEGERTFIAKQAEAEAAEKAARRRSPAIREFDDAVEEFAARRRISRHHAMRIVRESRPELFAAAYG
jgi:hypothetical protein